MEIGELAVVGAALLTTTGLGFLAGALYMWHRVWPQIEAVSALVNETIAKVAKAVRSATKQGGGGLIGIIQAVLGASGGLQGLLKGA